MFDIFKKRWEVLLFVFGVLVTLSATFKWIGSLDAMPSQIQAVEARIERLEKRIRIECQHVGEFQIKDIVSLLKMAEQRQAELRRQRDKFLDMDMGKKKREDNPIFVTLEGMEKSWLEITRFLREEQLFYHKITLSCLSDQGDVKDSGDTK